MKTKIIKYDFKRGLPQEFEILDLATLYKDFKETITSIHRTGFYHIVWFQEGSPAHVVDFKPIKIQPGRLLFLNKDTVQRFDKEVKVEGKVILFTDSFFCATDNDIKFLRNTILFNDLYGVSQIQLQEKYSIFIDIFKTMGKELQNPKDHFQSDILKNELHNFLLYAERELRKQNFTEIKKGADLDYVMLFKDLLERDYRSERQVNYYAKQLIITEKRLNQATSKVLGQSPKELIDKRVLLEAKRILAHTTDSVKEIAYYLGFEEPTNFIKYFKKHASITPVEFRENHT